MPFKIMMLEALLFNDGDKMAAEPTHSSEVFRLCSHKVTIGLNLFFSSK